MAEWTKAADCKSVSKTLVGSNPTLFNIKTYYLSKSINFYNNKFNTKNYYSKKLSLIDTIITKNRNSWKKLLTSQIHRSSLFF